MKKLLKSIVAITTIATCAVFTSGCGSRGLPEFVMPETGFDTEKPVEITFYHTMGQSLQQVLDMYLEDFHEMYPNITVKHQSIGAYDDVRDQMVTEISTARLDCDMAYCYPDHVATYNKANSVVNLDTLIDSDLTVTHADGTTEQIGYTQAQKDDFVDAYYEEGKSFGDGSVYCLPFSKSSEVMYYNKTFFDEHDLDVPTTWDEVETVAKEIKKLEPDSIPFAYDSESNLFITMTEQLNTPYTSANEPHYLFNTKENKDFVTKFASWYQQGLMTTKEMYGSYTSGLFTSTTGSKCYMCVGSSAGASYQIPTPINGQYPFEVGIAPIPQADVENHPAVIQQGPDICIFRNKDPQKVLACWLLTKFLTTSVEFQAQFSMISGYTPVIESVYENQIYQDFLDSANGYGRLAALATKQTVQQSDWYFYSPAFEGSSKARDQVGFILPAVMGNTKSVDEAFDDAITECEY